MVEAQELERARLARELHDETGQALTSILLGLKALEERVGTADGGAAITELRDLVVATLQDVRRLAVELRPAALDDFGLVPALERLRDTTTEQGRIAVELKSDLDDRRRLPAETETALYRIVQEALTNVLKHAEATRVTVRLRLHERLVELVVQDNGAGFDPGAVRDGGLGLVGMRERVALLGGRMVVESSDGAGTMLKAEVPLPMIRVLIVDDHAVVRSGLRRLLDAEPDIETVGEAPNADRAVFEALESKPDVVLLDLMMPEKGGIEGMPALLQAVPEARVLVLSMQDDPRYVRAAFEAGASGYVLKEAADTEVVAAIRAVSSGERYVHPALGAKLVSADTEERRRAEQDPLSEREREVLRLLALGHTNQEIAAQLFISVRTAETHRAHIMQKLSLSSRAELVRYALEHGLIESRSSSCELRSRGHPAQRVSETQARTRCARARSVQCAISTSRCAFRVTAPLTLMPSARSISDRSCDPRTIRSASTWSAISSIASTGSP